MIATRSIVFATLACLTVSIHAHEYDPDNGEEINEVCATCHGEFGQGGKQGVYPRIAGLPAAYVEKQLLDFRNRIRPNIPMVEHTDEQELPDPDVKDISIYIEAIKLPTKLPPIDMDNFEPYERLLLAKRTFNVARAPGDTEAGRKIYNKECKSCHGAGGWGRPDKNVPFIAGQYTKYLWHQVELFLNKKRIHDPDEPDEELLADFSKEELRDIFAYLSIVDDQ
jgi:cytochrome c553